MSKNSELVTYFMGESFRMYKDGLRKFVAPNFVFKSLRYGELNFDNYVSYAEQYYHEEKVDIEWVYSEDDVNFGVAYRAFEENDVVKFGVLAVTVVDGLITIVGE